jgi:DNA-binding Lrp family transcriptional regulator
MAESAGNSHTISRWITRNAGGESVMAKAFVLIETTVGRTKEVATTLKELKGMTSVNAVTGPYDVIAIIEAETLNEIGDIVTQVIHPIAGISRTVTCLAV